MTSSSPAQRPAVEGADNTSERDKALVLDFVCRWSLESEKFDRNGHPAWALSNDAFHAAGDALELEDLVYWRKTIFAEFLTPTSQGLAAHAAAPVPRG